MSDSCCQLFSFDRFVVEPILDLRVASPSVVDSVFCFADETDKRAICCPTTEPHSLDLAEERAVVFDILDASCD